MRKLLLLLLLLLPVAGFCGNKHKPKNMPVSRWREVKRMQPDSTIVPFTDTMFMYFKPKLNYQYHNKNGFIYNGTYKLNDDDLDFGTARYTVAIKRPTLLVLNNENGIYVFATDSTDTVKAIILAKEDSARPVTSIDQMIGHWTVYKHTTKEQNGPLDMSTEIKAVYVTGPSTDGKQGFIYGGNDPGNNPSWYIKAFNTDQSLDCDGKSLRIIKVVKCQKGELILEENDVTYYFKQFK